MAAAGEKETFKALCFAVGQNGVQRGGGEAICLQYTSIVPTEAALLETSRNSTANRSQQRSSELIIYEVPSLSL